MINQLFSVLNTFDHIDSTNPKYVQILGREIAFTLNLCRLTNNDILTMNGYTSGGGAEKYAIRVIRLGCLNLKINASSTSLSFICFLKNPADNLPLSSSTSYMVSKSCLTSLCSTVCLVALARLWQHSVVNESAVKKEHCQI